MMSIEDHIYQAFSLILKSNQEGRPYNFEGELFGGARGPKDAEGLIDLSGQCGFLGFGHPLLIKAHLQLALKGAVRLQQDEGKTLYDEVNNHLSQVVGKKVFLSPRPTSFNFSLGRTSDFMPESCLKELENNESLSLIDIFGEAIGISLTETPFSVNEYSHTSLFLAKHISRLLHLGQFYGANGLIKRREKLLQEAFKDLSIVESITGLNVLLSKPPKSKKIISSNNYLLFPLSFDEVLLDTVKKLLVEENECM